MKNTNYENLVSIIAVAFIIVISSGFSTFAKQYPPKFIGQVLHQTSKPKVQGYVRPGKTSGSDVATAERHGGNMKTVDLLAELSPKDAQVVRMRFDQAASLLHAGKYDFAITALDQVIKIQPKMPEAYVNMGYAYLGLKEYSTAANAFSRAIDLRPNQVNAYYGLAEAFEGAGDYEGALGAMRSYIHLTSPDDPFVAKAQSAIWEWETKLGRNPSIEQKQKGVTFDPRRFNSPH